MTRPDIDICSACKDHTEFYCCPEGADRDECGQCDGYILSSCCGAEAYDTDYDTDT